MIYLKQSTASQEVPLGYLLDSTDGDTEETGLTIANTDIKVWKTGATTLANKNSGGATHISNGIYYATLDATDTNTLGPMVLFVHVAGALAVRLECCVLPANSYDSFVAGTDYLEVDLLAISGDTTAADNLESTYDGTGYTDSNAPATQEQIGNIAVAGAAINTIAESYTLTTGTQSANTHTSTQAFDSTSHQHTDTAGVMELYYQFDVGNDGVPVSTKVHAALTGNNDTLSVFAYNWVGTSWDQIGTLAGTVAETYQTDTYDLLTSHVGTGANVGKVRIRYYAASGLTSATLYIDQILVSYAQASTGIANGSTITLAATTSNANLVGQNWNLALGGQDISGAYVSGATVTGVSSGSTSVTFENCVIGAATLPPGTYIQCGIGDASGTFTAASAGQYIFKDCFSVVAGAGSPAIDFSGKGSATGLNVRGWYGGATYTLDSNVTLSHEVVAGGTTTVTSAGAAVEIRGTCRAITLNLADTDTSNTINVIADTGPVSITAAASGDTATVNLYGHMSGLTDTSNSTVNNSTANATDQAAILVDTSTTIPATIATIDTNVDAILADTGTDGVVLAADQSVDVTKISGSATAADNLEASALGIVPSTVNDASASTTSFVTTLSSSVDDFYNGRVIVFTSGNLANQATSISDYTGSTKTVTVTALTAAPTNGISFVVV